MAVGLLMYGAGTALTMWSQYEQGQSAADAGHMRRAQLEAEAKAVSLSGRREEIEKRKEGHRLMASQIAQIGAQGGNLTGSKVEIMAADAEMVNADANTINFNYMTEATRLRNEGKIANWQGDTARWAARIRTATTGIASITNLMKMNLTSGPVDSPVQGGQATGQLAGPNAPTSAFNRSLTPGRRQSLATMSRY